MTPETVPFVHLHFHTEFSLLDGANSIGKAVKRAAELGMPALALTDHGVMYGAIDFYSKAKKEGIKPIIGCESYMAHGRMHERRTEEGTGSQSNHQVLLAATTEGYHNLVKLASRAQLEGFYYKPRIDTELLAAHSTGLIGTSSCLKGKIPEAIVRGNMKLALELTGQFSDIFGPDNFFLELQNHGIEDQAIANRGLIEIARKTGIKLIASNDVHYLKKEHAEAHELMLCMQTGTVLSDPKHLCYGAHEFYLKSGAEMLALFHEFPEALQNTLDIAERCDVDLRLGKDLHFPTYEVPEGYTQKQYLIKLSKQGLRERYGVEDIDAPLNDEEKRIADRFYYELGIIEKTGFINYFLVVWDFIKYAHDSGIPVGPGRGSGAGSILAYALRITGIDPLRYNLFFERFLNPERVSAPDFDIDFCQTRRGEVIDYVKRKYGRDNVAQIITFGTLGPKTVIRDLARVLEIPLAEADKLAKMVPEDPEMTLEKALKESPEFRQTCERDPNAMRIMKYAPILEGLARNPGTHAAGVVIGEKPLIEIVPLCLDKDKKDPVTQYEMTPLGEVGLLKMDFLGLKTLTVIQEACLQIKRNYGIMIDLDAIPMVDEKTFALLNRGDTVGVFQVESKGMRELLRKFILSKFEDLIAMIALYRPGPMNMLDDFIKRRHGQVKIEYDHPLLKDTLEETFGVMVYQEQVMAATNVLAGFTLGEGDMMRRIMGKKKAEDMIPQRAKFVAGCQKANNIPAAKAGAIFDNIERFAGYGFNKSHSAAYAIISWQTAYLKAHYPSEFMAASLSFEIGNPDRMRLFIAECQAMGIELLPPSVNESGVLFTPIKNAIRFGMSGIKNVGQAATEAIVKEREANGTFKGLFDFCTRVEGQSANKKTLESLVRAGAFDFTGLSRARLFGGIEGAIARASSAQRDKAVGQFSLFGEALLPGGGGDEDLPHADPWPQSVELAAEKELLGFYISGHPLSAYEWTLKKYALANMETLRDFENKTRTRIGGLVTQYTKRFTKATQEPMCVFQLEQLDGIIEVVVFPGVFSEYGVLLREEAPVLVCGEVMTGDDVRMHAAEIYPLPDVHRYFARKVSVHLSAAQANEDTLREIKTTVRNHPGEVAMRVVILQPDGEKIYIDTDHTFKTSASQRLVKDLEKFLGEDTVFIETNPNPCLKPPRPFGNRRNN